MARNTYFSQVLLVSSVFFLALSCRKNHGGNIIVDPQIEEDTAKIRLKEVTVSSLPGTLYSFTFDNDHVATIDYSSGYYKYQLIYENDRLLWMINLLNDDRLEYKYQGKRVAAVNHYLGDDGERVTHIEFRYDAKDRVTMIDWYAILGPQDSIHERKVELNYNVSGNLDSYISTFADDKNELTLVTTYTFSDYDNYPNVESFGLFRFTLGDLIYLPSVRFLKNNPGKQHSTSRFNETETTYTYTYKDGLPQEKHATIRQIRGNEPGQVKTNVTRYSYY